MNSFLHDTCFVPCSGENQICDCDSSTEVMNPSKCAKAHQASLSAGMVARPLFHNPCDSQDAIAKLEGFGQTCQDGGMIPDTDGDRIEMVARKHSTEMSEACNGFDQERRGSLLRQSRPPSPSLD